MAPNNRVVFKTRINSINRCSGSVLVPFAIMLPMMLIFMAFSFNTAYALKSRSLISESVNEASLAVVALDNKNENAQSVDTNRAVSGRYINYFLTGVPSDITNNYDGVTVDYDGSKEEYYVSYHHTLGPLLRMGALGAMGENINVSSRHDSFGNTRVSEEGPSIRSDVVFVADYSASSTCAYSNESCNEYTTGVGGLTRWSYLNQAIVDIVDKTLEHSGDEGIQFALVPYDIGVPIKQEGKLNPAGGEAYSCSLLYKLNPAYAGLHYEYWAGQSVLYNKWVENGKPLGTSLNNFLSESSLSNYSDRNKVTYYLSYYQYLYYRNIVAPAIGVKSPLLIDDALLDAGFCEAVYPFDSIDHGEYQYSCGESDFSYSGNKQIANQEYIELLRLYIDMYEDASSQIHYSMASTRTVDVNGTIENLFTLEPLSFSRPIAPARSDFSPFMAMCLSPIYHNGVMTIDSDQLSNSELFDNTADNLDNFKVAPHLIGFEDDLVATINSWGDAPAGGGTDTMTGFLRSVPVIANGNNDNKVIIIISDGKDDSGAAELRDLFLTATPTNVCDAVKYGLMDEHNFQPPALKVSIHYIMLDPRAKALKDQENSGLAVSDDDYRAVYGKWFGNCMDREYLHAATDYDSLYEIASHIIRNETGVFIYHE